MHPDYQVSSNPNVQRSRQTAIRHRWHPRNTGHSTSNHASSHPARIQRSRVLSKIHPKSNRNCNVHSCYQLQSSRHDHQEYLIQKFMDNGVNSVFMGVGGSFDVLSGHIKRAPMWMQKANLEWLFRVANEPKRLFKRYFVGNVSFIYKVVKEKKRVK